MKGEIISLFKHKIVTDFFSSNSYVKEELSSMGLSFFSYPLMNEQLVLDLDILNEALSRSDVVVIMSPIDTSSDDKIKRLLSSRFNLPLERDFKTMEHLEKSFRRNRLDVPETTMSLSFFPKGSVVFQNKRGLQNGYGFKAENKIVICLPDEEIQIKDMYDEGIFRFLSSFSQRFSDERKVGIYGLTAGYVRAQLGLKIKKEKDTFISVAEGIDDTVIRITSVSESVNMAKEKTYLAIKKIMEIFGDYVYGVDVKNNSEAALNEILSKDLEISFADGFTKGELWERFSDIDGVRDGIIDYSSFGLSKLELVSEGVSPVLLESFSPLSEEVATALSFSSLCFNHSSLGVGIVGTPPEGGRAGKAIVSICDEETYKIETIELKSSSGKKTAQEMATDKIINYIRLFVRDYPNNKGKKSIKLLLGEYAGEYVKREKLPKGEEALLKRKKNLDLRQIYEEQDFRENKNKNTNKKQRKKDKKEQKEQREEKEETKGDFLKSFFFYLVLGCCILTLTVSVGYIWYYFKSSGNARELYSDIAKLHYGEEEIVDKEKPIPRDFPEDYDKSFLPLWQINNDVVGFLKIETLGAENRPIISYPVCKKEGDKNKFYDRRDFEGNYSRYGVPFVDYESDLLLPSDNIIIYGHNMKDGQMFGCFESYNDIEFFRSHPVISFDSVYQKGEYAIFGVFYASTLPRDNPFNYHCFVKADSKEEYNSFISEVRKRSLYNVDIDIEPSDQLVTLSTCVYKLPNEKQFDGGRLVLVGRKLRAGETKAQLPKLISQNKAPLMPAPYYKKDQAKKEIASLKILEKEIRLTEEKKLQLSLEISPKEADCSQLIWFSSDENVAKAFAGGLVEAVSEGRCVVSVFKKDGSLLDSVNISVSKKSPNAIEKLSFLSEGETIRIGDELELLYEIFPRDAQDKTVVFVSEDEKVLEINGDNTVKALSVGRTKVLAYSGDGRLLGEIPIRVVSDYINVDSLSISSPDLSLEIGKQTKLFLIITPLNATNADIVWESDNPDACVVSSSGKLTALKEGKARITARTKDNTKSDYINVTVQKPRSLIPVKEISLPKEISVYVGEEASIDVRVLPNNAGKKSLSYELSDSKVATVSPDGRITALKEGETQLTVLSSDSDAKATAKIKVLPKRNVATSLRFSESPISLNIGEKTNLVVLSEPKDSQLSLSFSSSKPEKLLVLEDGTATANQSGVVNVFVKDKISGLKASCTVKINEPINTAILQKIVLSQNSIMLKKGDSFFVGYTLEPETALNKELVFSSSDKSVATVSGDGMILAKGIGKAVITVKAKEGNAKASLQLSVLPSSEEDSQDKNSVSKDFRLSPSEIRLLEGEKAILNPKGISKEELKDALWVSDNEKSVTVKGFSPSEEDLSISEGYCEISALSEGISKVTLKTKSGKEAFALIYVTKS